jgi:polysaccharide chain length determinant protein (PEP-CTERM system associated)
MLPGKKYGPDDYLKAAWARKWSIVIPALLISVATAVVSVYLPNRYRSSTTILIIPQRVPEDYVRPTVTARIDERLQVISQQILSRTRLERIIQEFNLYERERQRLIMEDVIERMRQDIGLNINSGRRRNDDASAFTVSYVSSDARTAMLVTERLASLFVQENLEDRELLADSTNQFLQAQLEDARRRLIDHEKKLEAFRQRNNGRLPSQVQSNLAMMQGAQNQLQTLLEAYNLDRDRLVALETALADALAAPAPAPVVASGPQTQEGPMAAGSAAQQLEAARAGLRALELRLRPDHADVRRARRIIAELEAKAEAEALQQPLSTAGAPATTPVDRAAQARIAQLRLQIQELKQRLTTRKDEEARLQAQIQSYGTRVQAAPALESELAELMRDYATLQEAYTALLKKSEDSKIAVNLERRQIGEQFKILDGARLPERPISPDRLRINLMGTLGGLAFGLALAALREYRDSTFKTDDDLITTLALPVLAVIPVMVAALERRRRRKRKLLLASSASVAAALLAIAAVVVWRMRLIDAWLR